MGKKVTSTTSPPLALAAASTALTAPPVVVEMTSKKNLKTEEPPSSFKEKKRKKKNSKLATGNKKKTVADVPVPLPLPPVIVTDTADDEFRPYEPETVSVTSCLIVISVFVIGGAILFSIWEVCFLSSPHGLVCSYVIIELLIELGMELCRRFLFLLHQSIVYWFR